MQYTLCKKLSKKLVKRVKYQVKRALVRNADVRNHRPSVAQAQSWFSILNKAVFDRQLEMPTIRVKRLRGSLGECTCSWNDKKVSCPQDQLPVKHLPSPYIEFIIDLKPVYSNWKEFIETLAHEMVHLYQMTIDRDPYSNHNANFYRWRGKLRQIGLGLSF